MPVSAQDQLRFHAERVRAHYDLARSAQALASTLLEYAAAIAPSGDSVQQAQQATVAGTFQFRTDYAVANLRSTLAAFTRTPFGYTNPRLTGPVPAAPPTKVYRALRLIQAYLLSRSGDDHAAELATLLAEDEAEVPTLADARMACRDALYAA